MLLGMGPLEIDLTSRPGGLLAGPLEGRPRRAIRMPLGRGRGLLAGFMCVEFKSVSISAFALDIADFDEAIHRKIRNGHIHDI